SSCTNPTAGDGLLTAASVGDGKRGSLPRTGDIHCHTLTGKTRSLPQGVQATDGSEKVKLAAQADHAPARAGWIGGSARDQDLKSIAGEGATSIAWSKVHGSDIAELFERKNVNASR